MSVRATIAALCASALLVGCGGDEEARERPPARDRVPAGGYTCGELRSADYRDRQADAILDERGIEGPERARLKRRLERALFRACDPGPDYRRAADDVARRVLGGR